MNREEVTTVVTEVLKEVLADRFAKVGFDKTMKENDIDSIEIVEIFSLVIKRTGIKVPRTELVQMKTINDLIQRMIAS